MHTKRFSKNIHHNIALERLYQKRKEEAALKTAEKQTEAKKESEEELDLEEER